METKVYFIKYVVNSNGSGPIVNYTVVKKMTESEMLAFCGASTGRKIEKIKVVK